MDSSLASSSSENRVTIPTLEETAMAELIRGETLRSSFQISTHHSHTSTSTSTFDAVESETHVEISRKSSSMTGGGDSALVAELRRLMLYEFDKHPDKYHLKDVERIRRAVGSSAAEWPVYRFIRYHNGNVKTAFKLMREAYQWRNSFGVNDLSMNDFPREPFVCGVAQSTLDKDGQLVIVIRGEIYRRFPEINEWFKKGVVFHAEAIDQLVGERGVAILGHAAGCGLHSVDLDLARFAIQIKEYYPCVIHYLVVNDLPWILDACARLIMSWLPESWTRLIHFRRSNQLGEFLPPEKIPSFIPGGTMKPKSHLDILYSNPTHLPPLEVFAAQHGISEKAVKYFWSVAKPYIDEFKDDVTEGTQSEIDTMEKMIVANMEEAESDLEFFDAMDDEELEDSQEALDFFAVQSSLTQITH